MKTRISILTKVLPRYGEILIAIGAVINIDENLAENKVAIEKLKDFLITDVKHVGVARKLFFSEKFQRIIYDYTGKPAGVVISRSLPIENDKTTNVYLADFFSKSRWPIIVNRYLDNVSIKELDAVKISINIKKNVYTNIYGEYEHQLFFTELKEYLLINHMIVSKAQMKQNGDMLVDILIPTVSRM